MEISHSNLPPQIQQSTTEGARPAADFRLGQILQALVKGVTADGLFKLQVGRGEVFAQSNVTLQSGQQISLKVEREGPIPELRLLTPLPTTVLKAEVLRQVLPRMQSLGPALQALARNDTGASLPQPATADGRQAVRQVMETLGTAQSLQSADGVRQALQQSGLFTEARLAQGQAPAHDLKSALLNLAARLRAESSQAPSSDTPSKPLPMRGVDGQTPATRMQPTTGTASAMSTAAGKPTATGPSAAGPVASAKLDGALPGIAVRLVADKAASASPAATPRTTPTLTASVSAPAQPAVGPSGGRTAAAGTAAQPPAPAETAARPSSGTAPTVPAQPAVGPSGARTAAGAAAQPPAPAEAAARPLATAVSAASKPMNQATMTDKAPGGSGNPIGKPASTGLPGTLPQTAQSPASAKGTSTPVPAPPAYPATATSPASPAHPPPAMLPSSVAMTGVRPSAASASVPFLGPGAPLTGPLATSILPGTLQPATLAAALLMANRIDAAEKSKGQRMAVDPAAPRLLQAADTGKQVEGALARIQYNQLASLPQDEPNRQAWQVDLPLRNGERVEVFQLRIEEEKNAEQGEGQRSSWSISLAFDLAPLGPVRVRVGVLGECVSSTFWAERGATAALINSRLAELHQGFERVGLEVGKLQAHIGIRPPEKSQLMDSPLLDEQA